MAYSFGDGFDLYANPADAINGYWDSALSIGSPALTTGRFSGSQGIYFSVGSFIKSSGANDAVHHFVVAYRQTAAITGSALGQAIQLFDGTTAQCSIVFRVDGAILLISGAPNSGVTLDTYTGAFPVTNTWYAFEFEVVINNTTGSWTVRKNGNTSNDHSLGSLDTQNSANAYANKIQVGLGVTGVAQQQFDDFFWQSGASTGTWLGDIRCNTRYPTSDVQAQFSKAPTTNTQSPFSTGTTSAVANGTARYTPFVAAYDGTVGTVTVSLSAGYTGNMKCSLFAGAPLTTTTSTWTTTVLGSATTITNPVTGVNTFTFSTPIAVTKGTTYTLGFDSDTSSGTWNVSGGLAGYSSTTAYASFPSTSPTTVGQQSPVISATITITTNNCLVNEAQQDTTTSYVYDSTVNDADFYTIGTIGSVPASTIAVVTRGYMMKSDAGSRTAAVQLKSSGGFAALDPATVSAVTLSGSNFVATNTGTTSTNQGAHVPVALALPVGGGKYYFEFTITTYTGGAGVGVGMGLTTSTYSALSQISAGSNGSMCLVVGHTGTGVISNNAGNSGLSLGALTSGDVIGVAVDLTATNLRVWFRKGASGIWNNAGSQDPTLGGGAGGGMGLQSGLNMPFVTFGSGIFGAAGVAGNVITANFGASAFVGTPPAGYTAGWPLSTTVATPTLTLTTSGFQWASRMDLVDPNTSAAWTAAAVNAVNVGPLVVS